ncbi:MAG: hypothetical protein HY552_02555 [Elusimicrobia bacterium]|nr:hypothetical protein [Elusimicrobiota bacterium]
MNAPRADSFLKRAGTLAIQLHLLVAAQSVLDGAYLSEALTGRFDGPAMTALLVVTWLVYAFDRYVVHPEDQAAAAADLHVLRYARRHRKRFERMFAAALLGAAALACFQPRLLAGLLWGALLGAAYVVDVPLLGTRLKSVPYLKTLYVPFVYVSTVVLLLGRLPNGRREWSLTAGFLALVALNTVACDLKDRESDRRAGIRTIANRFPAVRVAAAAQALCVLLGWTFWSLGGSLEKALAGGSWVLGAVLVRFYAASAVPTWYYFVVIDGALTLPWLFFKLLQ